MLAIAVFFRNIFIQVENVSAVHQVLSEVREDCYRNYVHAAIIIQQGSYKVCLNGTNKKFTKGQEDVKDNVGSGQPKTHQIDGYIDRVRLLVHSNRQLSVQVMVDDLELVKEVVIKILTVDVGMQKIAAKDGASCGFFITTQLPGHDILAVHEFLAKR